MKNEYKEIENQLRKSLELWSDVMTESNQHGWGVELDFTDIDVFNAVNIMNSVCCNIAIKNGYITNEKEAYEVGINVKHLLNESFGIDLNELKEKNIVETEKN